MRLSFVTQNLTLKLFSLVVAILLFLFVSIESATPVDVDFRLEYHLPDDMLMVGDAPAVVHTTLRGPWAAFRSYDITELKPVVIDLQDAGPGSLRRAIDTSEVTPPGGMTVVAVRPAELDLTLDRRIERQVVVQPDIVGQPELGYELGTVEVNPARVRVSGPTKRMETLDAIATREVDVGGKRDEFTVEVELKPPLAPLRIKDKRVTVTVRFVEELVTRSFEDLPVRIDNAPNGTEVVPNRVTVKLKGPRNLVEAIDPATLEPYVDVHPEIDEGATDFDKAVSLPANPERTQWIGTAPKVQVHVAKGKAKKPAPRK